MNWPEHLQEHIRHLALPVFCMTYGSFAYLSRQMRAGMMDVIRSDFIRTARAKGLDERKVICNASFVYWPISKRFGWGFR